MRKLGNCSFFTGYSNISHICTECLKYYVKYDYCHEFGSSKMICEECHKNVFCHVLYKDSLVKKSHWEVKVIQLRRKKGDKKFEIEKETKKKFLNFFTNLGEKIFKEADYVSEMGFKRFIEECNQGARSIVEIVCRELVEKDIFIPRVGDKIYIEGAMYLSHGADDFVGGLATVVKVRGKEKHMVSVKEVGGEFAWEGYLAEKQWDLKELYGKGKASATPDYSPEFNENW